MLLFRLLVLAVALTSLWIGGSRAQATQDRRGGDQIPTTAGWVETAKLLDYGISLNAKLDTGALSSSLGVSDLERFKREGKVWYRFTVWGNDGKSVTIEQQTDRIARIMRAEVEDTRRPIVILKVCLVGHIAETDFTLTDRSSQEFPALIGRKFLASRILVDSSRTYVFANPCESGK